MDGKFTEGYVPFRFDVDDDEPNDKHHAVLQDIILAGSDFVHPQKKIGSPCYAELVVVFANDDICYQDDVQHIIRGLLNYYNKKCNWPWWKPFAWRKINTRDRVIVAVSLEKYD